MDFVSRRIENNNLIELPVTMEHATNLQNLPLIHRDPFDRLLISQSMVESIPLLRADKRMRAYPIDCIW